MKINILFILFLISIFSILWIDYEIVPHIYTKLNATKINTFLYHILLAYISSFIFYLIVVYAKQQSDKQNLQRFINHKINSICYKEKEILTLIEGVSADPLDRNSLTIDQLKKKFENIDLTQPAPLNQLRTTTYEGYFREHAITVIETLKRILILLPYLDTKLIDLIDRIIDCQFFIISKDLAPADEINQHLTHVLRQQGHHSDKNFNIASTYTEPFVEYLNLLRELKSWRNKVQS